MRVALRLAVAVVAFATLPAVAELRVVADAPFVTPGRLPRAVVVDPVTRKAFVAVVGRGPAVLASECETLKRGGDWQCEGIAFEAALPDNAGTCPIGTEPLYRLYNGGAGGAPNHRYTPSMQTVADMTASGWSAEGVGPDRVFACTPALR